MGERVEALSSGQFKEVQEGSNGQVGVLQHLCCVEWVLHRMWSWVGRQGESEADLRERKEWWWSGLGQGLWRWRGIWEVGRELG